MKEISTEIQQAIRERMDEPGTNKRAFARSLGITVQTLNKYILMYGGQLRDKCVKKQGVEDMLREFYPHYSATEIVAMKPNGVSVSRTGVYYWVKRLGLKHTPETILRLKQKVNVLKNSEDSIRKRNASRRRTVMMENFRHSSGMPQKTNLRMLTMPKRHYKAAWYLEHQHLYILTTDPYLIWYDKETKRTPMEQHYVETYGFRFEPAQD